MLLRIFLTTLLILIVLKLVFWLVNYVRFSQANLQDNSDAPQVNQMVKDPVCGVYIAVSEAVPLPTKRGNLYFCSNECRQKFLDGQK
jgi:YHS domain-containing protein